MLINAIPPLRYTDETRRRATCVCGQRIKDSGFGWVHEANAWVRLGSCRNAQPKPTSRNPS